jgi:hypothetical protein
VVVIAVSQDSARTWESSGVVSKTCAVRGLTSVRLDVLCCQKRPIEEQKRPTCAVARAD